MSIPGEDESQWNEHPHRKCISSPGMGLCLTGNGDVPHREWECASPGMHTSLYRVLRDSKVRAAKGHGKKFRSKLAGSFSGMSILAVSMFVLNKELQYLSSS